MAVREIVTLESERAEVLRRKTLKVTQFGPQLEALVQDMVETMHAANGVGLAAPQIGISLRLAVVQMPDEEDYPHPGELFVLCNPKIVRQSREEEIGIEGCLSIPGYIGEVPRATWVLVRAQDVHGKPVKYKVEGFLARAFQHEIDHLNGVLYIDRAVEGSIRPVEPGTEEEAELTEATEATETTPEA